MKITDFWKAVKLRLLHTFIELKIEFLEATYSTD